MSNNSIHILPIVPPELLHGFPSPTLYPAPPYQLQQSSTSSNTTAPSHQQLTNLQHQWVSRPYVELTQHNHQYNNHNQQQSQSNNSANNSSTTAASIMIDMIHQQNLNRSTNNASPMSKKKQEFKKDE